MNDSNFIEKSVYEASELDETVHDYLMMMAKVGSFVSEGYEYKVYVHGIMDCENNPIPHLHVIAFGKQKDNYGIKFDMELSLLDVLCNDTYTILNLKVDGDLVKTLTRDWTPYNKLKIDLIDFLSESPGCFHGNKMIDNLQIAVWQWNNEYDFDKWGQGINVLGAFLRERGFKPLVKYVSHLQNRI